MQDFPDRERVLAAERAAKARDFIKIYSLIPESPVLPLPFSGPDRAAFYFFDREPEDARRDIAEAKRIFGGALSVTFGPRNEWAPNGMQRQYEAELPSGLKVVLVARAADMGEDAAEDAGELVAA